MVIIVINAVTTRAGSETDAAVLGHNAEKDSELCT